DEGVVARAVFRLADVLDLGLHLRIDVLNERTAGGDVHHLHTETDAEGWDAALARHSGEREIALLAPHVHRLDGRMLLFAVDRGIAVVAAGEKDAVERLDQLARVLGLRRHRRAGGARRAGTASRVRAARPAGGQRHAVAPRDQRQRRDQPAHPRRLARAAADAARSRRRGARSRGTDRLETIPLARLTTRI